MNFENGQEEVYCVAGTVEGALLASLNRGAKALSIAGGITGKVLHQKMMRAPVFHMSSINEVLKLKQSKI